MGTTWGVGAYPLMAERLHPAAERAVARAGIRRGDRVIDVATGTGNAALLAADRGAEVVGVDFEPALLAVANDRAAELGVRVRWETGDATALGTPDHWAGAVLSVFGVMYASDHEAAARELARCAAPNAKVVLAAWAPGSLMPDMGRALSDWLPPPPPSSGPPSRWGDAAALAAILEPAGLRMTASAVECLSMTFADSLDATDFLVRTAGHVVAEQERLVREGRWTDLLASLRVLVEARGVHAAGGLRLDCEYLLATATPA